MALNPDMGIGETIEELLLIWGCVGRRGIPQSDHLPPC